MQDKLFLCILNCTNFFFVTVKPQLHYYKCENMYNKCRNSEIVDIRTDFN